MDANTFPSEPLVSLISMSEQTTHDEDTPQENVPRPATSDYGRLVDRMVEAVRSWPPEYQRSVDVHGGDAAAFTSSDPTEAAA
jgi:hypothetical protein